MSLRDIQCFSRANRGIAGIARDRSGIATESEEIIVIPSVARNLLFPIPRDSGDLSALSITPYS
jgi:hypothetical protein